jgi:hypothetical protein
LVQNKVRLKQIDAFEVTRLKWGNVSKIEMPITWYNARQTLKLNFMYNDEDE